MQPVPVPHINLPLPPTQVVNKCIVCPAHSTAFDLATGEVKVRTHAPTHLPCSSSRRH